MTDDRRKYKRVPALIDVVWEGAAGKYEARTSDLSVAGCFIDTIGQVTPGEMIKFKLRLPAGVLVLKGEVMYTYPNMGFGVRFRDIPESDQKRLEWLIKAEAHRAEER